MLDNKLERQNELKKRILEDSYNEDDEVKFGYQLPDILLPTQVPSEEEY